MIWLSSLTHDLVQMLVQLLRLVFGLRNIFEVKHAQKKYFWIVYLQPGKISLLLRCMQIVDSSIHYTPCAVLVSTITFCLEMKTSLRKFPLWTRASKATKVLTRVSFLLILYSVVIVLDYGKKISLFSMDFNFLKKSFGIQNINFYKKNLSLYLGFFKRFAFFNGFYNFQI